MIILIVTFWWGSFCFYSSQSQSQNQGGGDCPFEPLLVPTVLFFPCVSDFVPHFCVKVLVWCSVTTKITHCQNCKKIQSSLILKLKQSQFTNITSLWIHYLQMALILSKMIRDAGIGHDKVYLLKLMFSKKATKIDEILTVDLTLCSKCKIDGEDFVIFVAFLENMNFIRTDLLKYGFFKK